jgi:isoamylase
MTSLLATRICGSSDLYQRDGKEPINSINFVTCHDGFTLNDLVSYSHKFNATNGEDSRDGENTNYSDNHGTEGETTDPAIEATRLRQIKNMLATLLISRGVPMLLGGDEFRRTQRGNNNAYCQDNEISWYDWNMLNRNYQLFRFTREMIVFRRRNRVLRTQEFYADQDISWFALSGKSPKWGNEERTLGCMIHSQRYSEDPPGQALCILFNAETFEVRFKLPHSPRGQQWRIVVDTARPSPYDIREAGQEELLIQPDSYRMQPRSMVILIAK